MRHLIKTDNREIEKFIGPWYIWTFRDITCFSPKNGYEILNATMSIKRLCFLCLNIQLDDISTRKDRFSIFEQLLCNCSSNLFWKTVKR